MANRRSILKSIGLIPFIHTNIFAYNIDNECFRLKTSLNAFSFDAALKSGKFNLFQVIDYCYEQKFDAVDLTGYYFPGYPNVPSDNYIFELKRKAMALGIEISGTGVRTDFTSPDKAKRNENIELVKNWIMVAQKLGAPVIRIFAGAPVTEDKWMQTAERMIEDFKTLVEFGKKHGVIVAVQNHNDFIKTPAHVHYIFEKVNDPWFGLINDTGGFRSGDTYADTGETIKYTVNWQIKEKIFVKGVEMDTDIEKLMGVIKKSCYKGYIPIETLGTGEPHAKINKLMGEIRKYI
jgi:L-ribulose-5-phosphate 3-epimerase UlaE